MQVTMKNSEINEALNRIAEVTEINPFFPVAVSYCIARNERALRAARGPYDDTVKKIFAKYAHGADVIDRKSDPDAYEHARAEIAELDSIETTVDIQTFPLDRLKDRDDIPFKVLRALEFMISDGD